MECYLGIPCGGFVAAHAQPPPASERPRVHRDARRRPGRDRRPEPRAAARPVPGRDRTSSTSSSSRTRTRSCSPARRPTTGATPSSTRTRPRRCATRAGRPAARRASSTRTARRCCTRSASARRTRSGIGICEGDMILPVVPMFHANAWGYPYLATMFGAKIVYPGPHLDAGVAARRLRPGGRDLGGGRADDLDGHPRACSTRTRSAGISREMKGMLVGGSAVPRAMIAAFNAAPRPEDRPRLGDDRDVAGRLRGGAAGRPRRRGRARPSSTTSRSRGCRCPLVELRARDADGNEIPWDDETMGELEVRGPWVAASYYDTPEQADRWTDDGWFKTGDIVSLHPRGFIHIQDRSKDVIKSGGEWISSVALENALMGHPAIAEAAVIAIPSEKWDERPLAVCVAARGADRDGGRAARVPRRRLREVVAAGRASSSSTRSRRRRSASSGRRRCARCFRPRPPRRRSHRPSRRRPEGRPAHASSAGRNGSSSPTFPSPPARRWCACGRRA